MKYLFIILLVSIALLSCNSPVKKSNTVVDQKNIESNPKIETDALTSDAKSTVNTRLEGVDVSNFQTNVNWNNVKNDNISFVFVKATGGETYLDPSFIQHWAAVKKAEIKRGAYHFYYTKDDPTTQANFFISKVLSISDKGDLPPVIDIEKEGVNTEVSVAQLQQDVQTFLSVVEKAFGRKPILYTSDLFAQKYFDNSIFDKYYLWIAEYDVESPTTPSGWTKTGWTFWQDSPAAKVNGIQGVVDHDVFKGGLGDLNSL